ncbi:uncharacterized protein LOC112350282 [Selaginella moellendorffii]|uniref:uncharacterized protein LOC112350282 n=1 Tax=Selaginella moellendorffii TaxID=88036 RepID=UPI000D1CC1DB|nr:uncharacterized protein LOC112350282 [Selaginella moellendorffii]|eukprot:XP_024541977.1 uncharacterized protein LOC112350282 [Selaginella moellendorffii]
MGPIQLDGDGRERSPLQGGWTRHAAFSICTVASVELRHRRLHVVRPAGSRAPVLCAAACRGVGCKRSAALQGVRDLQGRIIKLRSLKRGLALHSQLQSGGFLWKVWQRERSSKDFPGCQLGNKGRGFVECDDQRLLTRRGRRASLGAL